MKVSEINQHKKPIYYINAMANNFFSGLINFDYDARYKVKRNFYKAFTAPF
jgi:hypothetical protein